MAKPLFKRSTSRRLRLASNLIAIVTVIVFVMVDCQVLVERLIR